MALKYYYDLMSQPCRAVYIFLKMNKIPFEAKPIALRKGENTQEWYTKINPFQRVPVIDDDGFILTESIAIMRYLSEKHKVPEHWFPKELQAEARHNEYLNWQHWNIRLNGSMVFQHLVVIPRASGRPIQMDKVQTFSKNTQKAVEHMDTYFLRDQKYLCGDRISVADLLGLCELHQLNACCREGLYEKNENVSRWVKRVKEDITGPLFEESHVIVSQANKMFKKLEAAQQNSKL